MIRYFLFSSEITMNSRLIHHIKNLLLPCLAFSVLAGFLSAILATAFKIAAEWVIHFSTFIYDTVRSDRAWIPLALGGAAVTGLAASFILSNSRSCRGGGIPTSVAAIRGLVSFRWIASVFILPFSALLTFLCGIPLGTEGPCVQMGTAVGDGIVQCLGSDKLKGWRRYIMTGGASAGFSVATSSPVSAIIFSMEELHKHFSPLLLTVASLSVVTAQITAQLLAALGIGSVGLFDLPRIPALPPKLLFVPILVGLLCGGISILFTRFYQTVDKIVHAVLKKIPTKILFPILFSCIFGVGIFLADSLGTGHNLVESLFHQKTAWYMLILIFLVRALFMMISNTAGATGGVFLPTLAFGAILGSLCAQALTCLGLISPDHSTLIVMLGITSFLGAASRVPVTACVFALEALGGINNALAVICSATVAFLIVELSETEDFTDTIIKAKVRKINRGKTHTEAETSLTVAADSFAAGKELRDILWPNSCVVVSFERAKKNRGLVVVEEGDVITIHYKTYNPKATAQELCALVGEQPNNTFRELEDPEK